MATAPSAAAIGLALTGAPVDVAPDAPNHASAAPQMPTPAARPETVAMQGPQLASLPCGDDLPCELLMLPEAEGPIEITEPASGDGVTPGESVTVVWDAAAFDFTGDTLYTAQVKPQTGGATWENLGRYACTTTSDQFPGGTCSVDWTPTMAAIYDIRVLLLNNTLTGAICDLEGASKNCDIVTGFYVDEQAPTVDVPVIQLGDHNATDGEELKQQVLTVTTGASDDLGLEKVTITATAADNTTASCDLNFTEGAKSVGLGNSSCDIDLGDILSSPHPGIVVGQITLTATAVDLAGNENTTEGTTHPVDTSPKPLAVAKPQAEVPEVLVNNQSATLTYRVTYATPPQLAGQPVRFADFTVEDADGVVCQTTTGPSGFAQCTTGAWDAVRTFKAGVKETDELLATTHTTTLTWTNLTLSRLQDLDAPRTNGFANVDEFYTAVYEVRYTHNDAPVPGALVDLAEESFETADANGVVRVPLVRQATEVVTFTSNATWDVVTATGPETTITWTEIVVADPAIDDAFVNVEDSVTLTAAATYAHDSSDVVDATLALGDGAPATCELLEGEITNKELSARIACDDIQTSAIPLAVASNPIGITRLADELTLGATWTKVNLTDFQVDDDFVNVNDTVRLTAHATYAHDALSPVTTGALAFDTGAAADCELVSGTIAAGLVTAEVACTDVVDASASELPLVVASTDTGVTNLTEPAAFQAIWTRISVTATSVDDAFVNVTDTVRLTGRALYAHDQTPVPSADLVLGPGAADGCVLSQGTIVDGNMTVDVACSTVTNSTSGSLPLVVETAADAVVNLTAPLGLSAIWTEIVVSGLSTDEWKLWGVEWSQDNVEDGDFALHYDTVNQPYALISSAAVNGLQVNDLTELSFDTYYAQGSCGAGAPRFTLYVDKDGDGDRDGVIHAHVTGNCPTGSWIHHDLLDGQARFETSQFSGGWSLVTQQEAHDLLGPDHVIQRILLVADTPGTDLWIDNVRVNDLDLVEPEFANVGDSVVLTGRAEWAHDDTNVATGTLAFSASSASADCQLLHGGIVDGQITVEANCTAVNTAEIPLEVTGAAEDVTRLAAPLGLQAVWTEIVVSNVQIDDTLVNVGDNVTLTATATYAHNTDLPVPAGTLAFGAGADSACSLLQGEIVEGTVTAIAVCNDVRNLTADGLPLVVADAWEGVVNLTTPLALKSIWTKVNVSYTVDTTRHHLDPNAPVLVHGNLTFAHDGSPVSGGILMVKSTTEGDTDEFVCVTGGSIFGGVRGQCTLEVTKHLGNFTFDVRGFSTAFKGGRLVPDVTSMNQTPAQVSYRWTAIAFTGFECAVVTGEGTTEAPHECGSQVYAPGTPVSVTATAVAADDEAQILSGARVTIGGEEFVTDSNGEASKPFTRFTSGTVSVVARGLEATFGAETVAWTIPAQVELRFEEAPVD